MSSVVKLFFHSNFENVSLVHLQFLFENYTFKYQQQTCVTQIQIELESGNIVLRKTQRIKDENKTTNSTTYNAEFGNGTQSNWWEASAHLESSFYSRYCAIFIFPQLSITVVILGLATGCVANGRNRQHGG